MSSEDPRRSKLTELVPDHRFVDVDRDELGPIVDRKRISNELGSNRRSTGPRLDYFLLIALRQCLNLFEQFWVNVWTLFEGTSHSYDL